MTQTIELQKEEIELLRSIQIKWKELTTRYGELHYQQKIVDEELRSTDLSLEQLDNERNKAVKMLQEKYGIGTINLASGEFIPDSSVTTK